MPAGHELERDDLAPTLDPAEDHNHFGAADRQMFWTLDQKVAGYRNMDKIYPTREIKAGGHAHPLPRTPVELSSVRYELDGATFDTEDFIRQRNIAGLLVIKDGRVVMERYALGNTEATRWHSASVAKSVTSMLVGAALNDGYIASVDEKVITYVPALEGSVYGEVTIRHLLQMASGVAWNEDYTDPASDVNNVPLDTDEAYGVLRRKPRVAPPGEVFNYNSAQMRMIGAVLAKATGRNLSTYLSEKIWTPYGMEADANWRLNSATGVEIAGMGISATLRDFGRIGMFALNQGRLLNGTSVLRDGWMNESTTPSTGNDAYGYLWWLGPERSYVAVGVCGQIISVRPTDNLVFVTHSARPEAGNPRDREHAVAYVDALAEALR